MTPKEKRKKTESPQEMKGIPTADKATWGVWKEKGRARPQADRECKTQRVSLSAEKQKEECTNMSSDF